MVDYVYLSIGSNIGDRRGNCKRAVAEIAKIDDIEIKASSSLYETAPVGFKEQGPFINMALKVETSIAPVRLLRILKDIEQRMGRADTFRWGPRIIDIDIILYGNEIILEQSLEVPHPRMLERGFVMIPLAEIGGDALHPQEGKRISELVSDFSIAAEVQKL